MASPFKKLAKRADQMKKKPLKPRPEPTPRLKKTPPIDKPVKSDIDIVLHNIRTRKTIRHYLEKEVPDAYITKIMDAARQAPSAGNYQPWEFVVIRDPGLKEHLVEACFKNTRRSFTKEAILSEGEYWMLEAPIFMVVCINERLSRAVYGERGDKLYGPQGVAAAIENMLLAIHAYGLGSCWIGAFSEERVATLIGCPRYVRPCAIITVGWPAEKPIKPERHALADIVHIERFGRTPREKQVRVREQLF